MDVDTIKCTQCSKSFLKKAKLTAHIKTVHSGIKYDCDFCEKQYGSKQGLTTHRKTIHKEGLQNSVDIPASNNPHSSLSPNDEAATALLRAKASSTKKDDQVNNAKKLNVAKKVPVQKSSSKVAEKDLKKETISPVSNLKNDNEFYLNEKQEKRMEKEILNKVNPKKGQNLNPNIKFDFTPFESQNRMEIKTEGKVSKEKFTHSLKDQPNHGKSTSFASDCQINHEECPDKHFDKPGEMVQTEVEDDDKESCLWTHCDNLFSDEELELRRASADDHSKEKVLELQASKGNNLKNSEVGFNASPDKPSHSTEPQNVAQNSGISLEKKTDISQETTPEEVEEFVCGTIGCKKKFTAKEDLDEHMKTADGQNRKCPLCLRDFFNEECRKYHKDQNCGADTESDEDDEDYEDDDEDFDEDECDEDDILDGPEKEIEGLKKENKKVKVMGREHKKLDVHDNLKETDDDKQIVLEPLDFDKDKIYQERNDTLDKVEANSKLLVDDDVQYSAKNAILTAVNDAQHSTIDGIQMPTKDVYQPTNAFIQCSSSYVQPKSDNQAPTQYAQHPTQDGIQPLTNYTQFYSKDTIETQQNNVQYPSENATQTPTNDNQRHTINVNQNATQPPTNDVQNFTEDTNKASGNRVQTLTNNFEHSSQGTIPITANNVQHSARSGDQKPANDIKPHTKNGNQGPVNDIKHPIESGNQVHVNDVKHPTKNDSEASSSDIRHPSGTNNELQNTDSNIEQSQNIRPGIEVEDTNMGHKNKAPKEKTLSLKEKQLLYRYEQQWKQLSYSKPMPYSPEQIIQMSQENFENISAYLNPYQFQFSQMIREKFLKLPSKPAPSNIMQETLPTDNSMRNKMIPKQTLKRKGDLVNNEQMSKKIHLDSKAVKEEDEDTSFNKIRQSVLKGLNLGKNHENYEVIIEDGAVKLRIIGKHDNSSKRLDEDNDKGSGQDNSKWKTYSDCNGGPTITEGWKMCFEEQTMEGRKVMVAKYMDPEGKFYNRGPNGYDEIPNFQK